MATFKGLVKFSSCADCWIEAVDEAAAQAYFKNMTEAQLRAATQWRDEFQAITELEVVSIEEM